MPGFMIGRVHTPQLRVLCGRHVHLPAEKE